MPEPVYLSPLAGVAPPSGLAIDIREVSHRGMIDLRGLPSDAAFMAATRDVFGVDLPIAPRTSVSAGDVTALWLAPDQWLILCPDPQALLGRLTAALSAIHSLAVDVSDMRAVIRVQGEGWREILMKGCSLDLLSSEYGPGTVRRLRYAEIAALLHVVAPDTADLYVFRSYAHYAWEFLATSARESGMIRLYRPQATPEV